MALDMGLQGSVQRALDLAMPGGTARRGDRPGTGGADFGALLRQMQDERLSRTGLRPASGAAPEPAAGGPTSDDLWRQAELRSLADGFGPGDALMRQIGDAADARWERQRDRHGHAEGLLDFMG